MPEYAPIKLFKVVALDSKNEYPNLINQLVDTTPHTEPFSSYYEAENWINTRGLRGTTYSIIEIFKIP